MKYLGIITGGKALLFCQRPQWDGTHFMPPELVDKIYEKKPWFAQPGQLWERCNHKNEPYSFGTNIWNDFWWRKVEDNKRT